jgi:hypothetical protein
MPTKKRVSLESGAFQSLRSATGSNTQTLHNILCAGILAAHLIEREFAVYMRINQFNELIIRIYDAEDKYELLIYPYEDAREIILSTCGRFGGKDDLTKALNKVNILVEALSAS